MKETTGRVLLGGTFEDITKVPEAKQKAPELVKAVERVGKELAIFIRNLHSFRSLETMSSNGVRQECDHQEQGYDNAE
jgi:hypothetical protein